MVRATSARPRGARPAVPAKMTSSILPPRSDLAPCSPMTQARASTTLDLPEPLGPTMQVIPGSSWRVVAEANDLNPLRVRLLRYTRAPSPCDRTWTALLLDCGTAGLAPPRARRGSQHVRRRHPNQSRAHRDGSTPECGRGPQFFRGTTVRTCDRHLFVAFGVWSFRRSRTNVPRVTAPHAPGDPACPP